MQYQPLFNDSYLRALWSDEFEVFRESEQDEQLLERLRFWTNREFQTETSAQHGFLKQFFQKTWGYRAAGTSAADEGYTCFPEYPVSGAGATGNTGYADLALGWFGDSKPPSVPQVLCEFKDVRSGLDTPQPRKDNDRSPVEQCNDYLQGAARAANRKYHGNPKVRPAWGIVTDMNEFRLFHIDTGFERYQRFVVSQNLPSDISLIGKSEAASFQRFVFSNMFSPDLLLSEFGSSVLKRRLQGQSKHEKELEDEFYKDYQAYREYVYESLVQANPRFSGSKGDLVRLTQRFLDRCIFALYCEDMGSALNYPPNLIRDVLEDVAQSSMMDRHDNQAWDRIRRVFEAMRGGGRYAGHTIDRFNGGLFEADDRLDELNIPTHVFCEPGQVGYVATHPKTLLYLSESYDFGATRDGGESGITLYTLGRIFEQSITELEIMEAEADGRASLNKITKRKRNGVYYTPETIVNYIVRQTIGEKLAELRRETGIDEYGPVTEEEARDYQHDPDLRTTEHKRIENYLEAVGTYREALTTITVVDPACGSGAFLIAALQQLVQARRWTFEEYNRVGSYPELFDADGAVKEVLRNNLYGVDVNAESVEITKLALWLNTAVPGKPLSALDHTIRSGNSLVGPDFDEHVQLELLTRDDRERINVFDWEAAFPEVFDDGGFDVVLGNPPYVKLQHFRKVYSNVAEYLVAARRPDETPRYHSTQTGNFDLYLPFIEKGMELLKDGGRLGFIAPSVWQKNEYGRGLRELIHEEQWLDRWVDFKSHQVFEEATTYTALQFYRKQQVDGITFAAAPDGNLGKVEWANETTVPFGDLSSEDSWNLQPRPAFKLIRRLAEQHPTLEGSTERIFQGLITSADKIYHLRRIGQNLYEPKKGGEPVEIEDDIMKPLVSGPEAKRFIAPTSEIAILFPYTVNSSGVQLLSESTMETTFPKAWRYLKSQEKHLRGRESGRFDQPDWYQFGRSQNLDKQQVRKLIVAQTVPCMRVCYDQQGGFCLNNVRVNGILTDGRSQSWYLLGLLNSSLIDFIFRRIAKPKDNGYFEANKQFIAPLPIARSTARTTSNIVDRSKTLQELHTKHRKVLERVDKRLNSQQTANDERELTWFWGPKCEWRWWIDRAPFDGRSKERNDWCRAQRDEYLDEQYAEIQHFLNNRGNATVEARDGEVVLAVADTPMIDGIFAEDNAQWIAAQWRHKLRNTSSVSTPDAKRLVNDLLDLRDTDNDGLRLRVLELDAELSELEDEILDVEAELDALVYELYELSDDERAMVEADKRPVL